MQRPGTEDQPKIDNLMTTGLVWMVVAKAVHEAGSSLNELQAKSIEDSLRSTIAGDVSDTICQTLLGQVNGHNPSETLCAALKAAYRHAGVELNHSEQVKLHRSVQSSFHACSGHEQSSKGYGNFILL